jgi:D-glycero-alpha-D-manno-heptose-7-phosphate kinase
MIGTQTPFRISFAGGGSDLAEFYTHEPGCVLSTSINKYMYIFIHPYFEPTQFHIKYAKTELCDRVDDIQHPIVREVLRTFDVKGIDVNSIADIPAGTGLGSSSSFTVGLLHALYAYLYKYPSKERLAGEACQIEIDTLKEPIGKQDQYAAAYGGLNFITFYPNGSVGVEPMRLPPDKHRELEESLLMFYLGRTRQAGDILKHQRDRMIDGRGVANLRRMTDLARQLRESLTRHNLEDFGRILDEGWRLKRELSEKISNDDIDRHYETALQHGALGGKLLGAGGSGFLLFYCEKERQDDVRKALGLRELPFRFDTQGSKVFYVGDSA